MSEPTLAEVREIGIRLLARREHSERELRRKLRSRDCPSELIDAAVAQLQEERLLSDDRFAEAFVRSRRNQGYGPLRIELELRERGIGQRPPELQETGEDIWAGLAAAARLKRFGAELPADARERNRQYRFLSNRGFSSEQIRRALAGWEPDPEVNIYE